MADTATAGRHTEETSPLPSSSDKQCMAAAPAESANLTYARITEAVAAILTPTMGMESTFSQGIAKLYRELGAQLHFIQETEQKVSFLEEEIQQTANDVLYIHTRRPYNFYKIQLTIWKIALGGTAAKLLVFLNLSSLIPCCH